MSFAHNCNIHHQAYPDPDEAAEFGYELMPHSYDSAVLGQAIEGVVYGIPTVIQRRQSYEFIADYLLVDTTNSTYQEMYDALDSWAVHIDRYYFQGGLTQGKQRYLTIRAYERTSRSSHGFTALSIVNPLCHVNLILRDNLTGKRKAKIHLLTTLVHEMVHAYLETFFNFCPVANNDVAVRGIDQGGHGLLWLRIYTMLYLNMRTWHPSLVELHSYREARDRLVPPIFTRYYYSLTRHLPHLRDEWDATNCEYDQMGLLRWRRTGVRSAAFKRALLRLSFYDYDQFFKARVPYPETVYLVCLKVLLLLAALTSYVLWRNGLLYGFTNMIIRVYRRLAKFK
ncbi:hypothetical protein F5Y19DRAFT_182179 [Xylariaceae sp. FL1651]|nr:hypothetical protein F5Y19DRAFT_182179 [Xylariaceae sp. FL1651]